MDTISDLKEFSNAKSSFNHFKGTFGLFREEYF